MSDGLETAFRELASTFTGLYIPAGTPLKAVSDSAGVTVVYGEGDTILLVLEARTVNLSNLTREDWQTIMRYRDRLRRLFHCRHECFFEALLHARTQGTRFFIPPSPPFDDAELRELYYLAHLLPYRVVLPLQLRIHFDNSPPTRRLFRSRLPIPLLGTRLRPGTPYTLSYWLDKNTIQLQLSTGEGADLRWGDYYRVGPGPDGRVMVDLPLYLLLVAEREKLLETAKRLRRESEKHQRVARERLKNVLGLLPPEARLLVSDLARSIRQDGAWVAPEEERVAWLAEVLNAMIQRSLYPGIFGRLRVSLQVPDGEYVYAYLKPPSPLTVRVVRHAGEVGEVRVDTVSLQLGSVIRVQGVCDGSKRRTLVYDKLDSPRLSTLLTLLLNRDLLLALLDRAAEENPRNRQVQALKRLLSNMRGGEDG